MNSIDFSKNYRYVKAYISRPFNMNYTPDFIYFFVYYFIIRTNVYYSDNKDLTVLQN